MDNSYTLIDAIRVVLKWKVQILIFVVVAAIASIIVSLMMTEYFESSTTFYPTNPSITDSKTVFGDNPSDIGIDYFGTKDDINRMLTIGKSSGVADYIINKYNLADTYDIDTTDLEWRFKVRREFDGNYTILKTEFGAIEITMLDPNPEVAASICRDILQKIDDQNTLIIGGMKEKILGIYALKLEETRNQVNTLTDTLAVLVDEYGIVQTTSANGENVTVTGDDPKVVQAFKVLLKQHESAVEDLNEVHTLYEKYKASTTGKVSSVYVVEQAFPSVKKAKPIRWLICASTTLAAFFLGIIGVLLIEQFNSIRKQL